MQLSKAVAIQSSFVKEDFTTSSGAKKIAFVQIRVKCHQLITWLCAHHQKSAIKVTCWVEQCSSQEISNLSHVVLSSARRVSHVTRATFSGLLSLI